MSEQVFFVSQVGEKGTAERSRADDVHDGIVAPVAKQFGLTVHRADRDPKPGQVTSQIIRALIEARIVVADLTGRNANVYYELGIAHAFQRPVVILVDKAASLTFDTQNEKVVEILDSGVISVTQAREASTRLTEVFKVVLGEDYVVESLVTSVATARSLDALAPADPMASEVAAMREQLDEIYSFIRHTSRLSGPSPDHIALRDFVAALALSGRVTPPELGDLSNASTSSAFEHWLIKMMDSIPARSQLPNYDDEEPF